MSILTGDKMEQNIDLSKEIQEQLTRYEFNSAQISYIINNPKFQNSIGKPYQIQMVLLTTLFYNIFINSSVMVPSSVRFALNAANDPISWLDDYKLVILPYIKDHSEQFFPVVN